MINILLTVSCFSGFVYASNRWLRIQPSYAPVFSISFIGILLFFFAIFDHLQMGTSFLIFSGFVMSIFWVTIYFQKREEKSLVPFFSVLSIFFVLITISFVLTLKMSFTVVDDFVYWGIMGKYLYINNHLPVTGNPLDPRILAYTPGTSLIHYFFYLLMGRYSVQISYFAQNLILISALFVVVKKENIKKSVVYICGLILLMTLFTGSVFTKLQVDHLLSIFCFSIFWMYVNEKNVHLRLLAISMPVCFLFLIKEIGFVIGVLILAVILLDLWMDHNIDKKNKLRAMGFLILIVAVTFLLKLLWTHHVAKMGFVEFHNAINWESIKETLHVFSNDDIQKGFLIFIKEVFIGSADRLNIPYLFWYGIVVFLWVKIYKTIQIQEKSRFIAFSGSAFMVLVGYGFLLYCLQIIVFKVGSGNDHVIGFSRYLNILFSPIVFMILIAFFHTIVFQNREISRKICITLAGMGLLILGASRVEVYLHRENLDIQVKELSNRIENKINNDIHSIGIITGRGDNIVNLQFLYHLLPNKVDYTVTKFNNQNELIQYLARHDYVLIYNPETAILEWLNSYAGEKSSIEKISFLQVQQTESENKSLKKLSIKRVLL